MNAPVNARTFKSGNSEAVRLPKGLGFGIGTEVRIEREGHRLVLTPVFDAAEAKRQLLKMLDDLAAMPKPDTIQKREPIEWSERVAL